MKAKLVGQGRPGGTRTYDLPQGEAVLGTERGIAIQVVASGVSRRHARVFWDGHHHYVEDLKGTNGTFLNGQSVYRERLQHLDVITLGRQCSLVYMTPRPAGAPDAEVVKPPSPQKRAGAPPVDDEPEVPTLLNMPRISPGETPKEAPAPSRPPKELSARAEPPSAGEAPRGKSEPQKEPTSGTEIDRDFLLRKQYKRPSVKASTSKAGVKQPPQSEPQHLPAPGAPEPAPPAEPQRAQRPPREGERFNGAARAVEKVAPGAPIRYAALVPEGDDGVPHVLTPGTVTLGRSVSCDIVPDSEAVSRFHARIEHSGVEVVLYDGGSLNGTFVNGKRIKTAILKDGDTLSLAGVQSYDVVLKSTEPVRAAPFVLPPPSEPERPSLATPIPKASPQRLRAKAIGGGGWKPEVAPALGARVAVVEPEPPVTPPPVPKWRTKLESKWRTILDGKWLSKRDALEGQWLRAPEEGERKDVAIRRKTAGDKIVEVTFSGRDVEARVSEPGSYLMGRTRSADLRIESPGISRRHALLVLSEDRTSVIVEDLESANGTTLNGQRVGRHRLSDGDTLMLGGFPLTVSIKKI